MESTFYTVDGKEFELKHHGIKGMKWGIRRTPKQLGHNPSTNANPKSIDTKKRFRKDAKRDAKDLISKYQELQKQQDEAYKKFSKDPSDKNWKAYMSSIKTGQVEFDKIRESYLGRYDGVHVGAGVYGGRKFTTIQLVKNDENGRPMVYYSPKVYYR